MNIWARYKGYLLNANCRRNEKVLIWGEDIKLLELGFEADTSDKPITYDKIVDKSELEELYEEEEFGTYKGMEFRIVNESPNTYRLSFDYNDYEKEAKQIELCETSGFVKIDKTIYEKEVLKTEVENYRIERENLLNK